MSPADAITRIYNLLDEIFTHQNWSALRQAEHIASEAIEALPAGPVPPTSERDIKRVQLLNGFRQLPTDNDWWEERLALLREAQAFLEKR